MRKLIFAITKQCDERIDEKAYRLESLIYLTSFVVSLLSIAALIFSILANSTSLVMIFAVPALISMLIVSLSMFDVSQLEERAMLEELSYEKLSESSDRKILYDRKIDESREIDLSLKLVRSDRQYSADREYELQYAADNITYALEDAPESEEFAYLYYRFSDKIVYHSHAPIYVDRIMIDSIEKIDVMNRFVKVKIDRIEEFDAEVKLSFEGREKIKNVKMIDVFFKVQNVEESEKKQSVYDELVERSK